MFYLINKTKGNSSRKEVDLFSKKLNHVKMGHSGTLDPLATGLLLIATQEDTKLLQYITFKNKKYYVHGKFGYATSTYDVEGEVTFTSNNMVTEEDFLSNVKKLSTLKTQIPPKFSAKKINGKRAYELARNENFDFEIKAQNIEIFDYKVVYFDYQNQTFGIEFNVSEGTYIRSLIYDLGLMSNSYATMTDLVRTGIGVLDISELKQEEYVKIDPFRIIQLSHYNYTKSEQKLLKNGVGFEVKLSDQDTILLLNQNKEISGIAQIKNSFLSVKKIFPERI
ncbi:tRNA pseudouridine(55) synthase TruB [Mycoplasmopsis alligatoris]|uniref:tRNA pseudouridine(55) synthase n=1 Tax=Mycoplasmopsis alligatoris A21JP2 TaxID=747682 RepID=D4XWV9_9BACT|nr:tRNA pseudouridine(55) synthase TruB [Mycoplasmopsis alligatoris]EFF41172.1 tRNA pseudouridine synthase B [Mycoplasmopsis alligatoris A21JP2]